MPEVPFLGDEMVRPATLTASEGPRWSFSTPQGARRTMNKITRMGIDLGKNTFHVCAMDRAGHVVLERRFTRRGLEKFLCCFARNSVTDFSVCF